MLACSHRSARIPGRPVVEARSHVALQPGVARRPTYRNCFPVRFLFHPLSRHCFGALAAPGACEASALPSAPFRFWFPRAGPPRKAASGLGSRGHSLPGGRDRRAEQEKRMYLNRITLIGFLGGDAEKKVSNATNIAVFSLATKTSWKNDAGTWESRTEWHRCVAFGRLAEFAGSLAKGAHVAIEGELRSHEYQREVVVGDQRTAIPQRVCEIRVDSVLKLDRAAKRESTGDGDQEVPR